MRRDVLGILLSGAILAASLGASILGDAGSLPAARRGPLAGVAPLSIPCCCGTLGGCEHCGIAASDGASPKGLPLFCRRPCGPQPAPSVASPTGPTDWVSESVEPEPSLLSPSAGRILVLPQPRPRVNRGPDPPPPRRRHAA